MDGSVQADELPPDSFVDARQAASPSFYHHFRREVVFGGEVLGGVLVDAEKLLVEFRLAIGEQLYSRGCTAVMTSWASSTLAKRLARGLVGAESSM